MRNTQKRLVNLSAVGLALSAGGVCFADPEPVSLVSFSWSATGLASPSAGANCDAGCANTSGCNSTVNSYSGGGAVMSQQFGTFFATRTCNGVCGGAAISTGYGQVDAHISIANPFFQAGVLQWQWSDDLGVQYGGGGGPAICGTSFATGQAGAANTWDTVFDVLAGDAGGSAPGATVTLLALGYNHNVNGGGFAGSAWSLERAGGATVAAETIDNTLGNTAHNATAYLGLSTGRYHFHHTHSASGSQSGNGSGSNASTISGWNMRFQLYTCANVTSGPQSMPTCANSGIGVVFTVNAVGNDAAYQWQWRPSPAAAWRVVASQNYNDSDVHAFDAGFDLGPHRINVSHADPAAASPEFRCIVSNNCATVTSPIGKLFIDASDMGVQGGAPGRDGLHDNNDFVVFIGFFFNQDARADVGKQGGILGSDGLFDNNDFVTFINLFFAGC